MDKKDEKVLVELIKNSRIPINQLAKRVGVSREVATYRISQLQKQGIIKEFYTEIDESKLGFERFGCCVQLKGISDTEEKKLINHVAKSKYVTYLGPIIGKWNFAFDIIVKSRKNLEEVLSLLFFQYKDKVKQYVINSMPTERGFFPAKVFGSIFEEKDKISKEINVAKIDLEILKLLRVNSRIEYSELSRKLKLTGNAIKYRIKNLENSGVIELYTIALDYRKINVEFYNLQIRFSEYDFAKLKKFLREHKSVKYFYKHIGNPNWDLDLGLLVRGTKELREFLTDIRERFGESIEINEIFLVPEAIKENILPDIVFE
ncbi:MAG: winged helix-turn-helix transcriptional regulator [Nanoarchaeota archaeon]|jgi:Lrp/AsnC family leucine-responsive transcriptional regulator|nr:winged helix-turn-helix transcriptional regulator [Nanoarchaeota archaeon]